MVSHEQEENRKGNGKPPNPPEGGEIDLPRPPSDNRKRNRDRYSEALNLTAAQLFPGAFNGRGGARARMRATEAIRRAQSQDGATDGAGVLAWVERYSPDLLELR